MMRNYNKYKKFKNNKRSFNPYIICAIVMVLMIGMTVGYASFTDILTVTGTANARYEVYTITYELNGGTNPANPVTQYIIIDNAILPIPTKTGWDFGGWYDNDTFDGEPITSTTGQASDLTLYAKWQSNTSTSNLVTDLREGDHVMYVDANGTSRECVVLYDSTSSYGIQVITTTTVEQFEIGNGTGSSSAVYNVSSNSGTTKFAKAKDSYNNARQNLNEEAREYLNSDLSPANGARVVGSPPNNPDVVNDDLTSTRYTYINSEKVKNGDTYYTTDLNQMNKSNINAASISSTYWLGSLHSTVSSSTTSLYVRIVRDNSTTTETAINGDYQNRVLCVKSSSSSSLSYSYKFGLRPVFTLKDTLYYKEGATSGSPYILSVDP